MFVYNERLNMEQKKNIFITGKSLPETLRYVFTGTGIGWQIRGNHIILDKANKVTVSGYVTDYMSMETLIGASVRDGNSSAGSFTNSYGYYSIQLDSDSVDLQVTYIGYKSLRKKFFVQKDTIVNFRLQESNTVLDNVIIYNNKEFSPSGGSVVLESSDIRPMSSAFSENDIIKSFQTMPGIRAGIEGSAGMLVRGGSPDQNLILVDGSPVYNTSHIWGLLSVFNGDAVKKVSLHKGSFPARFGGRLSSVVDIRFKDGDMQNFHGDITMGTLAARLNVEGPLIKGKTSFSFSARRSYIDSFLRLVRSIADDPSISLFYLYDMNAKINHKFSDRSRLYLSYYSGRDKLNEKKEHSNDDAQAYNDIKYDYIWGNDILSLRWNYVWSSRLFMNVTAAYNKYKYNFNSYTYERYQDQEQNHSRFQKSGIKDWQFSSDLEYQPDNNHYIRFGGGVTFHHFSPEMRGYQMRETSENKEDWKLNYYLYDKVRGNEMSVYAEDEFSITKKLKSNLGVHFSLFHVEGKNYLSFQPRLSFGYEINPKTAIKISYTKMNQYVNLLTSNIVSQPTDLWVPITKNVKPMSSHQFTSGLFYNTGSGYKFSVEGFYKQMDNILEYMDGIAWKDASTSWEEYVTPGKGWVYGMELFAQKTQGRFSGWLGYTLSWNERRFEAINGGRRFRAKYDSRHNFNITTTIKCSNKIDFSGSWVYATGSRSTLPLEQYPALPYDPESWNTYTISYIGKRNNYKMSDTHHLDIEMKYYRSSRKLWTFGVYNVYNRFNPYSARVKNMNDGKPVIIENSLIGIVPSISFTYKFK